MENSSHYGKVANGELTTLLSLSSVNLNRTPGSVAVSVDLAVSCCKEHSMSIAIQDLQRILRKRRNKCVLFTQVAKTKVAREFWSGKLTKSKRASLLPTLMHMFDDRYTIFGDTEDMSTFFE